MNADFTHFCKKCGFIGVAREHGQHERPKTGDLCPYMAPKVNT